MAEQERLTNKERRAQSREERKRKEEEARKRAQKQKAKGGLVAVVIVALVGFTVFQAFFTGAPSLEDTIELASAEVDEAQQAAGCEVLVDREPLPDRSHFGGGDQPDPDAIYPDVRPTHSGPHLEQFNPVREDGYRSQVSETATTHNLEHGAVIVWYDPDQIDGDDVSAIQEWNALLNANGFREQPTTGAGVTSSPFEDPGISSGQAVAFRAWGVAMDCDEWDETVANGFAAQHFGTRGISPERTAGPYPQGVLEFTDLDVDDTTSGEAPLDGEPATDDPEELEEQLEEEGDADPTDVDPDDEVIGGEDDEDDES